MNLRKRKNKKFWLVFFGLMFLGCFFVGKPVNAVNPISIGGGFLLTGVNMILYSIYSLVMSLFAISIWLLNQVISPELYSTVFFSPIAKTGINTAWSFVRDFFNLFFILIIVLIGLGVILGVSKFKDKTMLLRVIFAAMLINFSKPLTLFAIDISQIFMRFFAESIAQMDFAAQLGKLIKFEKITSDFAAGFENNFAYFVIIVVVIVMVVIMTIMLFYLAISLIIRLISFWVLIILSPIAMFGLAMEGTKLSSMKDEWLKSLMSWCFYGPVFLFFLWLTLILTSTVSGTIAAGGGFASVLNPEDLNANNQLSHFFMGVAGILIPYITAVYLLFYGYDKAKSFSDGAATKILDAGSKKLSDWGKKSRNFGINTGRGAARLTTIPGRVDAMKEGLRYGMENDAVLKRFTKKGQADSQAKRNAQAKKRYGGDKEAAEREYYRTKAQEQNKKWKENPPENSEVDEMFNGKDRTKRLAAILYKSQNNQLGFDKEGNNQYETAMEALGKDGDIATQQQITRETKKENLGAFIDYEKHQAVQKKIKEGSSTFNGLVRGTDEYNEAMSLDGIEGKIFDKHLSGNLNEIFKKQNENLYEQEGVVDYLYDKHKDKKWDTRKKFGENIKNTKAESYLLSRGKKGKVLLGVIDSI